MMDVKNAPAISGLTFRHFRGESDYARMAAVLTASQRADQVERKVTADDLSHAFRHLTHCDPYADMIIAEVSGEMVGYARGWWEDETFTGRLYKHNGFLVPEWRRKGIGRAMLMWMEDHFHEISTSNPPESAKFLQVNVSQFQTGAAILLERSAYRPIRYFYEMVRPALDVIVEYPLPDGLEIRPVTPDNYCAIWKSVNETSQEEWGYTTPMDDDDYQEWLTDPHFQPHLWQVAWDVASNQVVGHVLTFIDEDENKQFNRKRGYTEGVGVDQTWRRRGLARALISRSLQAQKAAGMTESALVADSDSTSGVTRLYESCGFQIVQCDTIYRKAL